MKKFLLSVIVVGIAFAAYLFVTTPRSETTGEFLVVIPKGATRTEISDILAEPLSWNDDEKEAFASIYAQMQWMFFNNSLADLLAKRLEWSENEKEIFLTTLSSKVGNDKDILAALYIPGEYVLSDAHKNTAAAADLLVSRISEEVPMQQIETFLAENITDENIAVAADMVTEELELRPDLSPMPPLDLTLSETADGRTLLSFSTTYYNHGRGPLELVADPETRGLAEDIERIVFQRIYRPDGSYRDKNAGEFLWHQEHLHYHFADFISYDLEAVRVEGEVPDLSGLKTKSTFCIRDISKITLKLANAVPDAEYEICGKELQGISVGWGDTYFFNYPDQNLDVSDLPPGTYKLTFVVNPEKLFDEVSYENNISSVTFDLSVNDMSFEIKSEFPENSPEVEHIYPKQDCSNCTL